MQDRMEDEALCFFCKTLGRHVLISSHKTKHTSKKLDLFVAELTRRKLEANADVICELCVQTVNELDAAQQRCEELRDKLLNATESNDPLLPCIVDDSKKLLECDRFDKILHTSMELKSQRLSHDESRPHVCEICGRAYKQRSALDVHVGLHDGVSPYMCSVCGKSFTQKVGLQRHIPIHTGGKKYQCEQCGKRFLYHSSLSNHLAWHTGNKKHECELCGLVFMSRPHLKRHTRSHTGEKRFVCPVCGKRFTERYNLSAHQKLHEK